MKQLARLTPPQLRRTALAAVYTALAAALGYLLWFHFDPDSLITWLLAALWLLVFNLTILAYQLARRSIWGNHYASPVSFKPLSQTFAATATLIWHGELSPAGEKSGSNNPALRTFEHAYWCVSFENGRQVIVNKQLFLDWLYECWFRQDYYQQTHKKRSAISQDLGDKEIGRYQWQARIWLLDLVNALERNTTDRRSIPKLRFFPYKIVEMIEEKYPSESN